MPRKIVIKTCCPNLYHAPNSCQSPTIKYLNYLDSIKTCKENLPPPWTHGIGTAKESPIRQIVKTKRILKFIFVGDCCHVWNQNWTEDKPKNSLWFKVSPSLSNDVRIQKNVVHSGKIQTMVEGRIGTYFWISF